MGLVLCSLLHTEVYYGSKSAVRESFLEEGTPEMKFEDERNSTRWSRGMSRSEALEQEGVWHAEGTGRGQCAWSPRAERARRDATSVESHGAR